MNDYDLWLKEVNLSDEQVKDIMARLDINNLLQIKSKKWHKDKSKIHGTGLFATENIKNKEYVGLAAFNKKRTTLGRYTNHSKEPNIELNKSNNDIIALAIKPINKGEELTLNYRHIKMKEQTLVEMGRKIDSLIKVSQKLIQEIQQIDTLSRGTLSALQLFMGKEEWEKVVKEMKELEEKQKPKEPKLDLNEK